MNRKFFSKLLFLLFFLNPIYVCQASTFVALNLPMDIKNSVGNIQGFINRKLKEKKLQHIQTIQPENLHISLQFIDKENLEKIKLNQISKALQEAAQTIGSIDITNNMKNATFTFLGNNLVFQLNPQPQELFDLVNAIRLALTQNNIPYDTKFPQYIAHLTIGSTGNVGSINFLKKDIKINPPKVSSFVVDKFVLKSAFKDVATIQLIGKADQKDLRDLQKSLNTLKDQLAKLQSTLKTVR